MILMSNIIVLKEIFSAIGKCYLNRKKYRRAISCFLRIPISFTALKKVILFMHETRLREWILENQPSIIDVIPRNLFYTHSTSSERAELITQHFEILEKHFSESIIKKIYSKNGFFLFSETLNENEKLTGLLRWTSGDRKEGLLAIEILFNQNRLYQVNCWLQNKNNNVSFYIGSIQGPNTQESQKQIKKTAKYFADFRPKNLIIFLTRIVAKYFNAKKIICVSNQGYYAQNGIRFDRKLKTDLNSFWNELGGNVFEEDFRFFEIPINETRKSIEEMKLNKRSMYRRRFKILDELEIRVASALKQYGN